MPGRKYSGPLMKNQKSTRRKPKGYKKPKKSGLSKLEKDQVKDIINDEAESKYFQSKHNLQNQALKVQSVTTGNEVMVRAFAIGTGEIDGVAQTYGYESVGGAPRAITPLHMSRTFDATTVGGTDYEGFIPDGKYVSPSMTKCFWRLHRNLVDTGDANDLRAASPYIVRFLRVRPRKSKFSDVPYVPRLDLFVNNFGVNYGIDTPESTFTKPFGLFEMLTSKVNSRKYQVIEDKQFQLSCPNVNGVIGTDIISSETNKDSQKTWSTQHKMPKKLYFQGTYDTDANRQPLAGQSNELIFFHVGVEGTTTKDIGLDANIDVKPISTFKDI